MFNTYDSTRPYDNQMGYPEDVLDRFWSKVKFEYNKDGTIDTNACMIWTARKDHTDYGKFDYVHIINNKKCKNIPAHRFSLSCYIGPLPIWEAPDYLSVRHKNFCHNRICVNPLHLEIGTNQQNVDDKIKLSSQARGSSHGASLFEDEEIFEILELSKFGMTQQEIADKFSVARGTIASIITGNSWSHLTKIKYTPKLRLTDIVIREIRQKLKLGISGVSLAKEYCVSSSLISQIKNNKARTNIV
jgi:DNA-binding XRE family transcriptional regulator